MCADQVTDANKESPRSLSTGIVRPAIQYLWIMSTKELIAEIERLPVTKRLHLLEETLRGLRKDQTRQAMSKAAKALEGAYRKGGDLKAFTAIDLDNFYEAR